MRPMTAKPPSTRFRAFYLRQLEKGLKMVQVWVPKDKTEVLKEFARGLRQPPEVK